MTTTVKDKCPNVNIDDYVMPVNHWLKRFEDEYYSQLERLTGLKQNGHLRPHSWAQITKEVIYDHFPDGVYKTLKSRQLKGDKLHQQLTPKGLELLQKRLETVINVAKESKDLNEFLFNLNLQDMYNKGVVTSIFEDIDTVYQEAIDNARKLAVAYGAELLSKHTNTSKREVLERLSESFLAA
jgi:hypothetical protein